MSSGNNALHPPGHIFLAALLGGPIAGCIVLAHNYKTLGRPAAARQALIWGGAATLALFPISYFLPAAFPRMAIPAGYTMALYYYAKTDQRPAYDQFIQGGGAKASVWKAAGIGAACLLGLCAIVFALSFVWVR